MIKVSRSDRKALLLGCCGFICILMYWWMIPLRIVIQTERGSCLALPTHQGDEFSLRFVHSVHKTPVKENFVVGGVEKLTLVSTEYQSYGVGMPFLPSEGIFTQVGNWFRLTMKRNFTQIPVRVGPEAQLTFYHQGNEYPLYQWLDPGSLVYVRITYDYFWLFSRNLRDVPERKTL